MARYDVILETFTVNCEQSHHNNQSTFTAECFIADVYCERFSEACHRNLWKCFWLHLTESLDVTKNSAPIVFNENILLQLPFSWRIQPWNMIVNLKIWSWNTLWKHWLSINTNSIFNTNFEHDFVQLCNHFKTY